MKTFTSTAIIVISLLFISQVSFADWMPPFNYQITDDYSGGDCQKIGFWYPQSKTCVLTSDLDQIVGGAIRILSDGITLDGNGYAITHDPSDTGNYYPVGVYADHVSNVTVKNLTVSSFHDGIFFNMDGSGNNILDNTVYENVVGIIMSYNKDGIVSGNTITNSSFQSMICSYDKKITIINNNLIDSIEYPLHLYKSQQSLIKGNYWSIYDSPDTGCYDDNSDGICDEPFQYKYKYKKIHLSVTDMMPYTTPNGWE